jgi:bacillopeptidase F (M6 metalloprotease family)
VSTIAAWYDRPGIFDPHSGEYYVYSQQADESYKRLGATFTLPAGSPSLKFWVSFDIEDDWDYAFVEISVVGSDVWTTLPDLGGLSTTDTGESCTSGWVEQIHPFLAHYMDADCNPTGTTGAWNAFTGRSGGWQQLEFDLSTYAGQTVELYISYASDWGTQNLGAFIDDIDLSGNGFEDFETGMGVWETSTAPGSEALNNWIRRMSFNLPEGPVIRTPGTVYMGFGFEAIDNAEDRNALMDNTMKYLGQQP